MEKLIVNGIEIAYTRQGRGTPLMLVHGFPLDHHLWDGVAPLLEGDFDLIIPDLRGFGESTTVDTPYTMDDLASDLAGLLDHLGIGKAAIAGHSMGGYVALAFARLYTERMIGLGLIATQALADPPDRKEGRYKAAADVDEKGIGAVVDAMTTKFTTNPDLQKFARENMEKQQPAAYIGALKAMAERLEATPLLASIDYPVVVIHGDADMLIPVERAREVRSAVVHAQYTELKGVGHMPMMEAPQETVRALLMLK